MAFRIRRLAPLLVLLLAAGAAAETLPELAAKYEREKGKTFQERYPTIQAIADLNTEKALRFLLEIVEDDPDTSIRSNTIHQIGRMTIPAAFDALLRFYREGDRSRKSTAFNAIVNARHWTLPDEVLEEARASTDQGLRSNVVRYFGLRDDPRVVPEAERFLADFPNGATSIVYPLTQSKPTAAAARLLLRIYDDDRQQDRDRIPTWFAEGGVATAGVLIVAIRAAKGAAAANAAVIAARGRIGAVANAIVGAVPKAPKDLEIVLLECLGAVGAESIEARDVLLAALESEDAEIAAAAVRAFRDAPGKDAIPVLIDRMLDADGLLAAEIRVTLELITGQQLGMRADLWARWWKEHGTEFDPGAVKKPADDALNQALVDLAIEKGSAALERIRGKKPPWDYSNHGVGTTALVALALQAAGFGEKDPDVRVAVRYVTDQPVPEKTYETALVAMALEALNPRRYRKRIGECARRLMQTQLDSGMWGYPNGDGDNSNSQYAVLGLRSAARAGIRIPQKVWRSIHDHFDRTQNADGGWSYQGKYGQGSSVSMTAAGVSSLLVCLENLKLDEEGRRSLMEAIDRGFDCLGEKMNLDRDSLYALYGIERAGVLGRRNLMAGKPWYVPGAKRLVDEQGRDGFWRRGYNEPVQTAFAILFLKKATAPIGTK